MKFSSNVTSAKCYVIKSYFSTIFYSRFVLSLKCYTESFYIKEKNKIRIFLKFLVKNLKVSFASSLMKNIVVFVSPSLSKFSVKQICCITFGSASNACCLLISICCHLIIDCEIIIVQQTTSCRFSLWPGPIFRVLIILLFDLKQFLHQS